MRLADHTVKLLRDDDFSKALEIVRLASKDVACTVSWNHLIDYEMSQARVSNAVKLYNEMKKRAQLPDAYTFTILFRGLSWYPHLAQSTARVLSIYQSMFAENSPVRPSIIHTNAVLKVCALANDVDAMLGIAAVLPTRGSGAPDNLTFTTILNAIRSKASGEMSPRNATSAEENTERNAITTLAVQQGRRLWLEVRQRWISGDLRVDEEFVCAMGRLLLLGSEAQDQDDILSLLEQTMGIPRQIARRTDLALGRAEKAPGPSNDPELPPPLSADVELETLLSAPKENDRLPRAPSDRFAPLPFAATPTRSAVRPGRNTLSLVLDACIHLKYVRAAQNYWGLLTSPDGNYKLIPDSENYHMYLRLLRLQRSSKLAVELVNEMRSGDLTGKAGAVGIKTFRIALSCCVRDINNKESIHHAAKLVRMMMDTLPYPDAKALSMYLHVALNQKPRDWRVIMGAVRGTDLGVRNLRSLIAYGAQKQNEQDILDLVNGLIGAFDVVLDLGNEEIKDEDRKRCKEQRFTLAAYVTRMHTTYKRLITEGKRVEEGKVDDRRTRARFTINRKGGSEGRSGNYRKAGRERETDRMRGEGNEAVARRPPKYPTRAGPGNSEWKREGNLRGREEGETKDRRRSQGGVREDGIRHGEKGMR